MASARERTEQIERETLSPSAVLASDSKGREREEPQDPLRTVFQRDRDRIVHSKSFRRLKHKTQVFLAPEGDHYRVRLTHTLDVSQIARTAARALRLNEDLTEAIALGHDLGHTPFGHLGEEALTPFLGRPFRHSEQSLRIVDYLENEGQGLNLTWEVRDGIVNHPWSMPPPSTLEAQVVRFADRIAYVNHDVDDAVRAGVLAAGELPSQSLEVLGSSHSERINTLVTDLVSSSEDAAEIRLSPAVFEALDGLRDFMFREVYLRPGALEEQTKAMGLIRDLFAYFLEHPDEMPPEYHLPPGDLPTRVADYIAGMTDRYALRTYERLFLPGAGSARAGGRVAGRIRQEDVEAVRDRTDIVKLVSQYLALKRTGHDAMSGLCPFHQEKTPSFSVSPSKQVFYCFGCGKGGDAIAFVRELESLTFVEAIERLAQQAGVRLRYEGDSPAERRAAARRQSLIRANEQAAELYSKLLAEGREGADARAYLAERGMSQESIQLFGVGYAPGYPDFLLRRMSKDFSPEVLLEAGLATRGEDGTMRDRFRGRITFPIRDLQSRAIGFGARILPTDSRAGEQAKYLNTAETPIYRKNEVLYNLPGARQSVARSGQVFVVEGYTDVIGLAQAGIENAVATCGTALGEGHFRLLARFAQRAVLAFDSDEAGARAAERAFEFHQRFPIQAMVMIMPEGLDPADLVAKQGPEAVQRAAAEALPLVDYMVRRTVSRHELTTVEGRSAAVAEALPILEQLEEPVRRTEYGHLLADLAGVSETSVMRSLEQRLGGRPQEVAATVRRTSAQERVEREMLKLIARDPVVFESYAPDLTPEHFRSTQLRKVFEAIVEAKGDLAVVAGSDDPKLAATVAGLAVDPLDGEETQEYVHSVWSRLQEFLLKSRSDAMRAELQRLNPTVDPHYDERFKQLVAIDGELRRLRESDGLA